MRAILALAALGLALLAAVAFTFTRLDAGASSPEQGAYRGSEPPARFVLPRFALRDHQGRAVRSESLAGRVVLLTFLDAQCRESCPLIAAQVAQTVRRINPELRANVTAIAISTDPAEDTPAAVGAFLRRTHAQGALRYLTRPTAAIEKLWASFQILSSLASGKDSLHSAPVRIYDPSGVWVSTLHAGVDLTDANLIHDLELANRSR